MQSLRYFVGSSLANCQSGDAQRGRILVDTAIDHLSPSLLICSNTVTIIGRCGFTLMSNVDKGGTCMSTLQTCLLSLTAASGPSQVTPCTVGTCSHADRESHPCLSEVYRSSRKPSGTLLAHICKTCQSRTKRVQRQQRR